MQRAPWILGILLFFTVAVFATCETTPDKISRFEATYDVLVSGDAQVTIVIVAECPEACLLARYKEKFDANTSVEISSDYVDCPKDFLLGRIGSDLGNFPNGLVCTATFADDKNHVRMNFTGIASHLAKSLSGDGVYTLALNDPAVPSGALPFSSALPSDSSLKINFPTSVELLSHAPSTGQKLVQSVFWAPFPKEVVTVSYNTSVPASVTQNASPWTDQFSLVIVLVLVVFLLVLGALVLSTRRASRVQSPLEKPVDKRAELAAFKQKIQFLEQSYMKKQIDETTYRRLFEQYQLQMTELKVAIKKEEEGNSAA